MTEHDKQAPADKQANEGEGSRTAARAYNRKTEAFAKSGNVEQKARDAQVAVDGAEGKELAQAEADGKARATIAGRAGHGKP